MKYIDARMCKLVALVALNDGRMDANDPSLEQFSDDRPDQNGRQRDDTFNLCFNAGMLCQVQYGDDDVMIELGS